MQFEDHIARHVDFEERFIKIGGRFHYGLSSVKGWSATGAVSLGHHVVVDIWCIAVRFLRMAPTLTRSFLSKVKLSAALPRKRHGKPCPGGEGVLNWTGRISKTYDFCLLRDRKSVV